jgi:hypothetical protein
MKAPDEAAGKKGKCPKCGTLLSIPSLEISVPVSKAKAPLAIPVSMPDSKSASAIAHTDPAQNDSALLQFVTVATNGHIHVNARTAPEAKLAMKELRLLKKGLALRKRDVTNQQRAIRAQYTDSVRHRGSKLPGLGKFGRFIRVMQTSSRDRARRGLATALEPLEKVKQQIDAGVNALDRSIAETEMFVLSSR